MNKIVSKTKKNKEKPMNQDDFQMNVRSAPVKQPVTLNLSQPKPMAPISNSSSETSRFGTLKKNKKVDKSQISGPTGFRVVQHVGLTDNNFEVL